MSARSWTYLAILLGLVFHGALLPFTYGQTYDAYIHMFFGSHYFESWFDPWETRWYTGFTVTAYPPGSHQALGLLIHFMDMRAAFIIMQLVAVALLITGTFRFSRLWVNDKAASYAAMLCVFSTSISETLHIFGQLPTVLSIALFLNAIPHISGWIEHGKKLDLFLAIILTAATTSVHHVTPLFGTVFFVAPVGVAAWLSNLRARKDVKPKGKIAITKWASPALIRGIFMGLCMLALIVTIVFPYWHWSITDPITQVSIPHGSRENFIAKPNLGFMFFVIPWGLLIFAVPYVISKSLKTALWPLGLSVLIALLLGTGGTTPFPKMLLGPAFEILTLDRFTFWASLLILPFVGLAIQSLWEGRGRLILTRAFGDFISRAGLVFTLICYVGLAIATALLPSFRPTQPDFIDPAPIVKFMDEDRHSDWRYLTLGFGDQFAYHSALINAESVDGNYHSARRLPSLMNYSVERLENSKYAGVPGLASLNQFLTNAEKFHLKYIFSNDEFYDPALHYTGWNPVTRLNNGVRVWEKPDITPLPDVRPRRAFPRYQTLMWGILPIGALTVGFLTLLVLGLTQNLISAPERPFMKAGPKRERFQAAPRLILIARAVPFIIMLPTAFLAFLMISESRKPAAPEAVVQQFYQYLDFRDMAEAYDLLIPNPDIDYGQFLRIQKLTGGLVPSFGKLTSVSPKDIDPLSNTSVQIKSELTYLTSIGSKSVISDLTLVQNEVGHWRIKYVAPPKVFTQKLTASLKSSKFRDLTGQFLLTPTSPVQRLARPKVDFLDAEFIERKGRMYIVGRIKNNSALPACTKVLAQAASADSDIILKQHSGRLGAHRLLPGEASPFRIDFEGYLKIQDQDFNAAYDPEHFSVAELDVLPSNISLNLSTTVCAPEHYKALRFTDMKIFEDDKSLNLTVSNDGTEIVSTLQIKLSYLDAENRLVWITPYYLQNNLVPAEERQITIPLSKLPELSTLKAGVVTINGQISKISETSLGRIGVKLPNGTGQILMDYDAMIYRPLD
ncbi:MAG: hypothetical protein ABJG88_09855 [Litorimonas sp.]